MGVQEHYVSSARVTANAAWTASAFLLAAAWSIGLLAPGEWKIAGLLAVTSIIAAIVAATMQLRMYVVKVCALIRRTSGVSNEEGGNVHAMR